MPSDPPHVKDKPNVSTDSRTVNDQHAPVEGNAVSCVITHIMKLILFKGNPSVF